MFSMARKFTLAETAGQLILASCDVYILGCEKTFFFSKVSDYKPFPSRHCAR